MTPSPSFLIGISGGTASGKSTFAAALAQALSGGRPPLTVEALSTDRYFLPLDQMPKFFSAALGEEMPDYNQPESVDFARMVRDLDTRRAAPNRPDVLLVEGLLVLHLPEIRQRLDLRLYIDLEADQRALRRLVRNLENHYAPTEWLGTPRGMATYYLESARAGHAKYTEPSRQHADFILRGDGDFTRTAPLVAAAVRGMMNLLP